MHDAGDRTPLPSHVVEGARKRVGVARVDGYVANRRAGAFQRGQRRPYLPGGEHGGHLGVDLCRSRRPAAAPPSLLDHHPFERGLVEGFPQVLGLLGQRRTSQQHQLGPVGLGECVAVRRDPSAVTGAYKQFALKVIPNLKAQVVYK